MEAFITTSLTIQIHPLGKGWFREKRKGLVLASAHILGDDREVTVRIGSRKDVLLSYGPSEYCQLPRSSDS